MVTRRQGSETLKFGIKQVDRVKNFQREEMTKLTFRALALRQSARSLTLTNLLNSGALARKARAADHHWSENVMNSPSEKIWQSRDRTRTIRPHHRHINAKIRVVCGEGFLYRLSHDFECKLK